MTTSAGSSTSSCKEYDKEGYLHLNTKQPKKGKEQKDLKFERRYFTLECSQNLLSYYRDNPQVPTSTWKNPNGRIDTRYITKVSEKEDKNNKHKDKFLFEIITPKETHIVASQTLDERIEWIEKLSISVMNPGKELNRCISMPVEPSTSDFAVPSRTRVVGGVSFKKPSIVQGMELSHSNRSNSTQAPMTAFRSSTTSAIKVFMEGWCMKQGGLRKNWKRRYFRLNVISLAYYENEWSAVPIRTIQAQDMKRVQILKSYSKRDNLVQVDTPARKFFMQPDNEADCHTWRAQIEKVMQSNPTSLPPRTKSV